MYRNYEGTGITLEGATVNLSTGVIQVRHCISGYMLNLESIPTYSWQRTAGNGFLYSNLFSKGTRFSPAVGGNEELSLRRDTHDHHIEERALAEVPVKDGVSALLINEGMYAGFGKSSQYQALTFTVPSDKVNSKALDKAGFTPLRKRTFDYVPCRKRTFDTSSWQASSETYGGRTSPGEIFRQHLAHITGVTLDVAAWSVPISQGGLEVMVTPNDYKDTTTIEILAGWNTMMVRVDEGSTNIGLSMQFRRAYAARFHQRAYAAMFPQKDDKSPE